MITEKEQKKTTYLLLHCVLYTQQCAQMRLLVWCSTDALQEVYLQYTRPTRDVWARDGVME